MKLRRQTATVNTVGNQRQDPKKEFDWLFPRDSKTNRLYVLNRFNQHWLEESFLSKLAHLKTILPSLKARVVKSSSHCVSAWGTPCALRIVAHIRKHSEIAARRSEMEKCQNEVTSLNVPTKVVCRKFNQELKRRKTRRHVRRSCNFLARNTKNRKFDQVI